MVNGWEGELCHTSFHTYRPTKLHFFNCHLRLPHTLLQGDTVVLKEIVLQYLLFCRE